MKVFLYPYTRQLLPLIDNLDQCLQTARGDADLIAIDHHYLNLATPLHELRSRVVEASTSLVIDDLTRDTDFSLFDNILALLNRLVALVTKTQQFCQEKTHDTQITHQLTELFLPCVDYLQQEFTSAQQKLFESSAASLLTVIASSYREESTAMPANLALSALSQACQRDIAPIDVINCLMALSTDEGARQRLAPIIIASLSQHEGVSSAEWSQLSHTQQTCAANFYRIKSILQAIYPKHFEAGTYLSSYVKLSKDTTISTHAINDFAEAYEAMKVSNQALYSYASQESVFTAYLATLNQQAIDPISLSLYAEHQHIYLKIWQPSGDDSSCLTAYYTAQKPATIESEAHLVMNYQGQYSLLISLPKEVHSVKRKDLPCAIKAASAVEEEEEETPAPRVKRATKSHGSVVPAVSPSNEALIQELTGHSKRAVRPNPRYSGINHAT